MSQAKKILSVLLAVALTFSIFSDIDVSAAENPEKDSGYSKIYYGYEDPPFDTSNTLYKEQSELRAGLMAESYPERFSLVKDSGNSIDEITPVLKDQIGWGCCWAFSSLGSAESSLYSNGKNDLDFSERQLAYFTYHGANDSAKPEDGTEGDSYVASGTAANAPYIQGGNFYKAISTLTRGSAPELEENVPYPGVEAFEENNAADYNEVGEEHHFVSHYQLRNANFLPNKDANGNLDGSAIKDALMRGTSVGLSYKADQKNYHTVDKKYPTYYFSTKYESNHAVQIVGWDDSISASNFIDYEHPDVRPSVDGGWLIKNSWGEPHASEGGTYFYISYADCSMNLFCAFTLDNTEQDRPRYTHNYQYDGLGQVGSIGLGDLKQAMTIANVFNATGDQTLKAVAFYTTDPGATYSIQVYTDVGSTPDTGTPALTTEQSGAETYPGYHTVDLTEPVKLSAGEKFSVAVTLQNPNGGTGPVAVEKTVSGCTAHIDAGESFYKGSTSWIDISQKGYGNVCLKAFTDDQGKSPSPAITIAPASTQIVQGGSSQFTAAVTGTTNQNVVWEVIGNNSPSTIIDSTGKLTVASGETAPSLTVRATCAADSSVYAEAAVTVLPAEKPSITITPASAQIVQGGSGQFAATVTGTTNKSVVWSVTGNKSPATIIDSTGKLTVAVGETAPILTVRATCAADSSVYAEAAVTVLPAEKPSITITPASAQIVQGGNSQFAATVSGTTNKSVVWSVTGNKSTSTEIDNTGKLTLAAGETAPSLTVRATCAADSSVYAEAAVTVLPAEKPSITITPASAQVVQGGSRQFSATVTGIDNKKVLWTVTGNKSQSTVIDSAGKLTVAINETSANLTVRVYCAADFTIYKEASVTVTVPGKPNIVITPVSTQIKHGESCQFSAAVSGTDYKSVIWVVSGNMSASTVIDSNGNLTVAADETADALTVRVHCAADLSVYAEASVTVMPPDKPVIFISPVSAQVVHGGSHQFSAAVSGTDNKSVIWTVAGNNSPSTIIDKTGKLTVAGNETAASVVVRAACAVDPSVYAQAVVSIKKKISSFDSLKISILYQYVVKGTPVTSLKLPLELNAVVDGKSDTPVKILKWIPNTVYNPDNPTTYYFTPLPDSEYIIETGVILPVIQTVVYVKKSNSSHSGGGSHGGGGGDGGGSHSGGGSGGGSGTSAAAVQSSVAVSNTVGTTTVSVTAQTDSSPTVVDHRVSISMQAAFNFTAAQNNATVQNHSRVEIVLPSSVFIDQIHDKDINSVDITVKIPSAAVYHSDSKVDLSMELSSDVLQAAQLSGKEVTVAVADDATGKKNYSWTFKGETLKNSQALKNINMALDIKPLASDAAVNRLVPSSTKGALLTFSNNGVLPAPAAVSAYVADQGFKAGQNLYLYYYNPATGSLETADYPACRVDENGYANIVISHCSQYVLLPGQVAPNVSVTLDTGKTLKVKEGKTYQLRVTAPARPRLTCGDPSAFKVTACGSKGNNYYFKATAVGKAGKTTGFYVNGEKMPRTVATIIK